MIVAKTGLAGLLDRITSVVKLVRPVDPPAPAYVRCAGCRQGGRDDQLVPDPDQFTTKKGVTPAGDVVGNASTVPSLVEDDEPMNLGAFNSDPGAAAERLSEHRARQEREGGYVKLVNAAPVWCATCKAWYHAVRCYSLHRHS